jgi:hypothetical protein
MRHFVVDFLCASVVELQGKSKEDAKEIEWREREEGAQDKRKEKGVGMKGIHFFYIEIVHSFFDRRQGDSTQN